MTAAFNELGGEILQTFPQMSGDPVRERIDAAVAQALALDPERIAAIRGALPKEPSVTNRPNAP